MATHAMTDPTAAAHHAPARCLVAIEMSGASWVIGVLRPEADKISVHTLKAGDADALIALMHKARRRSERALGAPVAIASCYEAGYDGFWLHRRLVAEGIANHVIDPASLEVSRRARQVKTDRIDAGRLVRALAAHLRGEPKVVSVVRVPTPEAEDARRSSRERHRLISERVSHVNRIKGLCATQGIGDYQPLRRDRWQRLEALTTGDGRPLPPALKAEIGRELKRLELVLELIAEVEAARDALFEETQTETAPAHPYAAKMRTLARLKGIGPEFASVLAGEVFYRSFDNRRQLAGTVGLAPSPFASGGMSRDQGIGKSGNAKARTTMIELASNVAAPSAGERGQPLVPRPGGNVEGAAAADRHRGVGAQAARRLVALRRERPGAGRSAAEGLAARRGVERPPHQQREDSRSRAEFQGGRVTGTRQGCNMPRSRRVPPAWSLEPSPRR